MDLDPTTVTLALTTLASMAGNVFQTRRLSAEKAKNESAKEATDSATTAKAYGDARGDLTDCRKRTEKLERQNGEQAAKIEALESSHVVLTAGVAHLTREHRKCAEDGVINATERERDRKALEAMRAELSELRRSLT